MPRPIRKIAQGSTHHVFSRCHGKRYLLLYGKKFFIEAIKKCQEKYDFDLIGAEIVGNHFHLIIRTKVGKQSISQIVQYIKARIAEKYNRATGETGAFWNERFGSTVIEQAENPEQYLLWLLWYIGYNPVRKGLSRDPRRNEIGFINCYLDINHEIPIKITLHQFFCELGKTFEECVKKFLFYEEAYLKRLAFGSEPVF